MKSGIIASLLVIAILVGAGVGYLFGNANVRTAASTLTSITTSVSTATSVSTSVATSIATTTETSVTTVYSTVSTTVVSQQGMPVQVHSVLGPVPPFIPAGAEVGVSLSNVGTLPVTALVATLRFPSEINLSSGSPLAYVFHFNVTGSNPLSPGNSAASAMVLVGAGFQTYAPYPLSVNGTLQDGSIFGYVQNVTIFQLAFMEPSTSTSTCTGPYGYVCFGGNISSAEVFNCATAAATPSGCTWKVVSPSAPQYATSVTIWLETKNAYSGFSMCRYVEGDEPGYVDAYCIAKNPTSFWVAIPEAPPTQDLLA